MSYRQALLVDDDPVFRALAEDMVLDAGVDSRRHGGRRRPRAREARCRPRARSPRLRSQHARARWRQPDPLAGRPAVSRQGADHLGRGQRGDRHGRQARAHAGPGHHRLDPQATDGGCAERRALARRPAHEAPSGATRPPSRACSMPPSSAARCIPFFQAKVSMADRPASPAPKRWRASPSRTTEYANPVPYIELAERNDRIDDLTLALTRTVARHVQDLRRQRRAHAGLDQHLARSR